MTTKMTINETMLTKEDQLRMRLMHLAKHVRTDTPKYFAEQVMANTASSSFDFDHNSVARDVTWYSIFEWGRCSKSY